MELVVRLEPAAGSDTGRPAVRSPGDTVAVRIEAARAGQPEIGAYRLDVVFDPDSARFLELDSLPAHAVVNDEGAATGRIKVAGASPEGVGRTLFAARFELHGAGPDPIDVELLEAVGLDLQRLPVRDPGR